MKYSPRRNYLYPVLRPYADDYPNGSLNTELRANLNGTAVDIIVGFDISEASIETLISKGDAVCVAMLYCGATLYREMLRAGTGTLQIETSISLDVLSGNVEVHPAIVAVNNIESQSETAHSEYGSKPISIPRWNPLATDQPWHFQVNPSMRTAKGIFNREINDKMADGEFDLKCDVTAQFISVTANRATLSKLKNLSTDEHITLPSIYISGLVSAMAEIRETDSDAESHEDGWVKCIKTNLTRLGIDIGSREQEGSCTLFRAAQLLLGKPFDPFLERAIQEKAYFEEEC